MKEFNERMKEVNKRIKLMKEFNAWLTGSGQIQVKVMIKTAVKYFNSDVQTFLFNDSSRSFLHFLATQQVAAG